MAQVRCEFCHEDIDQAEYSAHVSEHTKLRSDGQQNEYVTLPPEERDHGN